MSEAPERIWVKTRGVPKYYEFPCEDLPLLVEYVRADRIEELEAKLARAVEALEGVRSFVLDLALYADQGHTLVPALEKACTILKELKGQ